MNLLTLGFSSYDIALLFFCPAGAVLGSFAYAITETISHKPPTKEDDYEFANAHVSKARGVWLGLRLVLGGILGLVLGLYFIGAIQETPTTLAKIVALSILAGYAAPNIWLAQENAVTNRLLSLINESSPESLNKPFKGHNGGDKAATL
ncbi:hypothetical protein [Amphritea japonica]|uniref:Uncharacterized protein n=1 Tax=Amphritea japonica ATCC BAA-1530 TaxID=1278309 RepID=A0A7R6P873_9GAMM|nr:hypothetical protein [Amphritea japonica]BBB24638.1 conserved hypothetical protein [Amphritea japonica ATCC BAA-1530]